MVPNYAHWLTDFRTVFVFALGPFLPMFVIFSTLMGILMGKWQKKCATNSGKWGIPEKNYKNVAQHLAQIFGCFPIVIPIKTEKITNMGRKGPRAKTKTVLKLGIMQNLRFSTLTK